MENASQGNISMANEGTERDGRKILGLNAELVLCMAHEMDSSEFVILLSSQEDEFGRYLAKICENDSWQSVGQNTSSYFAVLWGRQSAQRILDNLAQEWLDNDMAEKLRCMEEPAVVVVDQLAFEVFPVSEVLHS